MKLKVCGMKYENNITDVASVLPDYLGFIFYEKSARAFKGTLPKLPKAIKKTGVFVDASIEDILEKVKAYDLQAIQLHGQESPEFCHELKKQLSFLRKQESKKFRTKSNEIPAKAGMTEIIKVFSIKDEFDFSVLAPYEAVCDYFLFDTKGKLPGGNGYTFDWAVLQNYPSTKPFFLSGGIGLNEIENIRSFLKTDAAKYCHVIDINSKFEIEPGLKNREELRKFKKNVITRS